MNIHDKDRNILVDEILSNYKSKLDDLTMSELEEELEAEESTTKFGEIPYSNSRQESRGEIEKKNKRRSLNDQIQFDRMMAKWEKHKEYSKQTSREDLRQEPRRQSEK
jgi:hypothetical protein